MYIVCYIHTTLYIYMYIYKHIIHTYGLSTLCHNCGFACQQRVLKTFPGPDYLHSEDGVV